MPACLHVAPDTVAGLLDPSAAALVDFGAGHGFRDQAARALERGLASFLPGVVAERSDGRVGMPLSRLFDDKKPVFVHVPKNAGTSISYALYGTQIPHLGVETLHRLYPAQSRTWRCFAVLRDPIDRFVSTANFVASGGMHPTTAAFRDRVLPPGTELGDFVRRFQNHYAESPLSDVLFRPQASFVLRRDGSLGVAALIDHARLAEGLRDLFGAPVDLPRLNATDEGPYRRSDLAPAALGILEACYRNDRVLYDLVAETP